MRIVNSNGLAMDAPGDDEKVKGHEITAAPQPAAKPGPVIDLMEALRQSMKKVPEKKVAGTARKARKKA
jgi:non-homologous end joining protein Ku